jgi:hypothetical protein
MKYIKLYEDFNEPQIGEYVIVNSDISHNNDKFKKFISNSIGIIIKINYDKSILIKYIKIPANIKHNFKYRDMPNYRPSRNPGNTILVGKDDILYHCKNKEGCEMFLTANKYNL